MSIMTEQARTPALLVFLASHLLISISDSATTGFFLGSLQISAWNPTVVLCADRSQSWRAVLKLHFQKQEERSHRNFPPVTVYLITSFFFFFSSYAGLSESLLPYSGGLSKEHIKDVDTSLIN